MPRVPTRKRPKIPAVPGKARSAKIAEAYERLGITEEECNTAPRISHILRELPGKIDKAIEYLRGSDDADARKFLKVYDDLPVASRSYVPFEAYAVAANISTKRMLEIITGACFEQSTAAAVLLAKASHPDIVKASIKSAKLPMGEPDRRMLHQREGFAPIPKTQVLNIHGDVNTDNRVQSVNVGELSGIEPKMAKIADRFNDRMVRDGERLLESARSGSDPVDDSSWDSGDVRIGVPRAATDISNEGMKVLWEDD